MSRARYHRRASIVARDGSYRTPIVDDDGNLDFTEDTDHLGLQPGMGRSVRRPAGPTRYAKTYRHPPRGLGLITPYMTADDRLAADADPRSWDAFEAGQSDSPDKVISDIEDAMSGIHAAYVLPGSDRQRIAAAGADLETAYRRACALRDKARIESSEPELQAAWANGDRKPFDTAARRMQEIREQYPELF